MLGLLLDSVESNSFEFRQQIVIDKGVKAIAGRSGPSLKMFPTASEHLHYFNFNSKDEIQALWNEIKDAAGITSVTEANTLIGKEATGGATWSCVASYGKSNENRNYPVKADWEEVSKASEKYLGTPLPPYEDYVYKFNLPFGLTDVWNDINFYEGKGAKFHSTQKPIVLMERVIEACTNPGDIVLDFFGGSGSTGVACKLLGREYYGCELDPDYYTKSLERIESTSARLL